MKTKQILTATALAAVMTVAMSSAHAADDMKKPMGEKCYGVAKAGKNDCKAGAHSCAGHSTKDGDANDFIMVPKGLCEKLTGGTLKEDHMDMGK